MFGSSNNSQGGLAERGRSLIAEWRSSYVEKESAYRRLIDSIGKSKAADEDDKEDDGPIKFKDIGDEIAMRWGASTADSNTNVGGTFWQKKKAARIALKDSLEKEVAERMSEMGDLPLKSKFDPEDDGTIISYSNPDSPLRIPKEILQSEQPPDWNVESNGEWSPRTIQNADFIEYKNEMDKVEIEAKEKHDDAIVFLDRLALMSMLDDDKIVSLYSETVETTKDVIEAASGGGDEYKYRITLFSTMDQISIRMTNGKETEQNRVNLGTFDRFSYISNIDDNKNNSTLTLKYENGIRCPGGETRSAEVVLLCGARLKITHVSEPERCHYLAKVLSPAICSKGRLDEISEILGEEKRPIREYAGALVYAEHKIQSLVNDASEKITDLKKHFKPKRKAQLQDLKAHDRTSYNPETGLPRFVVYTFILSIFLTLVILGIFAALILHEKDDSVTHATLKTD